MLHKHFDLISDLFSRPQTYQVNTPKAPTTGFTHQILLKRKPPRAHTLPARKMQAHHFCSLKRSHSSHKLCYCENVWKRSSVPHCFIYKQGSADSQQPKSDPVCAVMYLRTGYFNTPAVAYIAKIKMYGVYYCILHIQVQLLKKNTMLNLSRSNMTCFTDVNKCGIKCCMH